MQLRIQSYPPLGEITTCPTGQIHLVVILEVPKGHAQQHWEIELWASLDSSAWEGHQLGPCGDGSEPTAFRQTSSSVATLFFQRSLQLSSSLLFTLRFRRGSSDSWSWARDICGHGDGRVIVPANITSPAVSALPLPDLSSEWRVSERESQSPGTKLWTLEADIAPSDNDVSSLKDTVIGKPWGSFLRYFTCTLCFCYPVHRS